MRMKNNEVDFLAMQAFAIERKDENTVIGYKESNGTTQIWELPTDEQEHRELVITAQLTTSEQ